MKSRKKATFPKKDVERFWSKVQIGNEEECWEWKSQRRRRYPAFSYNGQTISSHRFAFMISNGPIQEGNVVCHSCDNPHCCNPSHLFQGTHLDNKLDSMKKGRRRFVNNLPSNRGSKHGRSKLTEDDVREIRDSSETQSALAKRFGVNQSVISTIKSRKAWVHV